MSAGGIPLRNPRTGAQDGVLAVTAASQVEAVALQLRDAQVAWAALDVDARGARRVGQAAAQGAPRGAVL